jgi:hypothetical protein
MNYLTKKLKSSLKPLILRPFEQKYFLLEIYFFSYTLIKVGIEHA